MFDLMMALDEKFRDHIIEFILWGLWMSVLNSNYWQSNNCWDISLNNCEPPGSTLKEKWRDTKVSSLGTTNVWTKFHGNPSNSFIQNPNCCDSLVDQGFKPWTTTSPMWVCFGTLCMLLPIPLSYSSLPVHSKEGKKYWSADRKNVDGSSKSLGSISRGILYNLYYISLQSIQ